MINNTYLIQEFIKKWSKKLILTREQEYQVFHNLILIKHRLYLLTRSTNNWKSSILNEYDKNFINAELKYNLIHNMILNNQHSHPLIIKLQNFCLDTINVIIRYNLRLVVSVAKRKYTNKGIIFEDLLDEGIIGLLITIGKFDYRLNCKFSTYSIHWIKQRMFKCLNEGLRPVKLPMHIVSALNKLQENDDGEDTLRRRLHFLPKKKISFDNTSESKDYELPILQDTLVDETIKSDYQDFKQKLHRLKLVSHLTSLKPLEERILRLRYGINNRGIYTIKEVSRLTGYSPQEVSRLETSLIRKLKQKCKRKSKERRNQTV